MSALTTPTDFVLVCCNSHSPAATCASSDVVIKMLTEGIWMTCLCHQESTSTEIKTSLLSYQLPSLSFFSLVTHSCTTIVWPHYCSASSLIYAQQERQKNMSETDGGGDRNHFTRQMYSSIIFTGLFKNTQFPYHHWRNYFYSSVSYVISHKQNLCVFFMD